MGRLVIRYGFAAMVLAALVGLAYMLMRELTTPSTNEGLTALLGGLVGAVGAGFSQMIRDLYSLDDSVGGNGHSNGTEPPK